MNTRRDRRLVVLITVAIAAVLTLIPLPDYLEFLRPYWVALVLIYWGLETQGLVTLGFAFTIGLALDLLTGSLLGQHALGLVIITYLVTRFRFRLRFFPPWQQALAVLDGLCQPTGAWWQLTPSVFFQCVADKPANCPAALRLPVIN